jgi:hypothetical protein
MTNERALSNLTTLKLSGCMSGLLQIAARSRSIKESSQRRFFLSQGCSIHSYRRSLYARPDLSPSSYSPSRYTALETAKVYLKPQPQ